MKMLLANEIKNMWSNKHPHFECAPANRCVFHFISKGVLASKLQPPSSSTANTQSYRDFYMQMLLVQTHFGVAGGGSKFSQESRCNFHCPTHAHFDFILGAISRSQYIAGDVCVAQLN
jgi:hypothetical protein